MAEELLSTTPDYSTSLSYPVKFSSFENPQIHEAWLNEKSALKLAELVTIFRWDSNDGKVDDTQEGFNEYLLRLFKEDL
ncbi:MAG: hypothetical protein AB8E87_01965 [Prochlorococcus sp.]